MSDSVPDRSTYVGGSDIPAIIGVSEWKTAFQLALEKLGNLAPGETETRAQRRGRILEPAIAELYREEYAPRLLSGQIVTDPDQPWQRAQVDRCEATDDGIIPVEIKTSSEHARAKWGPSGTDDVPTAYASQLHWQMRLMNAPEGRLVALLGADDLRVYTIRRDPQIDKFLLERATEFWNNLQSGIVPEPNFDHPSTGAVLEALFRDFKPTQIAVATESVQHWKEVWQEAKETSKRYAAVADAARAHLLHFMREAAILDFQDGTMLEKKEVRRDGYTVEPCVYVDCRLKKVPKGAKLLPST